MESVRGKLTLKNKHILGLKILHLTHTDIRVDSRILKELGAFQDSDIYRLYAIGIAEHERGGGINIFHGASVESINLCCRSFRWMPQIFRHFLVYIEMVIKVLLSALHIRPHLIHCHDTPLLPLAVFLARIFRSKLIYDAHELESKKNSQSKFISQMTLFVEKVCWGRLNGFITVSNSIMLWYQTRFPKKESVLILNSPVIKDSPSKSNFNWYFHALYGISKDHLVFVYLGLFVPGRGVEKLLQVFSDEKLSSHIVFVGRGPQREIIRKYEKLNSRIHLHDPVHHDQVVTLVANADYGLCFIENVSLSDYYSLPNKLFEYAFAGLPVLASDFPDMREIIEKYELGAVALSDVNSITTSIVALQKAGRRRLEKDLQPLSWQTQVGQLKELYRRVLLQNNSPNF